MTLTLPKTRIEHTSYTEERPLFGLKNADLHEVSFAGPGESALKECSHITATHCHFNGKYPLWHDDGVVIENCTFTPMARAAIWYTQNLTMRNVCVEAPKMFREVDGLILENVDLADAQETLWNCRNAQLKNVTVQKGDYLFTNGKNLQIENFKLDGNYSFQYSENVEIKNAVIHSKDAFWNSHDVTVRDSEITGEYLGWHSHNLHLINCKISGTQPLCYTHNVVLENCTFAPDCDLAFEYASVDATILGTITSVKNPRTGRIVADGFGTIIKDEHIKKPADCQLIVRGK